MNGEITVSKQAELQLLESKEVRDKNIERVEVLEKVKSLALLSDNIHTTINKVAEYYEVPKGTIEALISEHYDEISKDGYKVLKGLELKTFKGDLANPSDLKFISSLSIVPKRAILRLGMLLRDSRVAKEVRSYLLNVEELAPQELRLDALTKMGCEISEIKESMKKIESFLPMLELVPNVFSFVSQLYDGHLETAKQVSQLYEILKIPENERQAFDRLVSLFSEKLNISGTLNRWQYMYKALSNWFSMEILKNPTKKDYVLRNKGLELVQEFVNGVLFNSIVINSRGNWVDLRGYKYNNVEYNRTLAYFDYCCAYCGKTQVILYPEHIKPQSNEKTSNCIYNIVPACGECNQSKLDNNCKDWYKSQTFYIQAKVNKLNNHWLKYKI